MADIAAVKERVQAYLTSEGPVQIDENGRYSTEFGSTRVFIEVMEHPNGKVSLVKVSAPILFKVPITPDVYKFIALHADDYFFGALGLWPSEDESVGMIIMGHTLLGDFLDKDELMYAVFGVAGTADDLDDKLLAQFGGVRYTDS